MRLWGVWIAFVRILFLAAPQHGPLRFQRGKVHDISEQSPKSNVRFWLKACSVFAGMVLQCRIRILPAMFMERRLMEQSYKEFLEF